MANEVRQTMTQFWEEHSRDATVEEMMLDSSATILSKEEKPEIISLLPSLKGLNVLELGAGIGRFTGHLAKLANQVTAVDFMQNFLDKNRADNGYRGNITFLQADVAQLELPDNSYDFVFSNWLFMYLNDTELMALIQKMLGWLKPGGYLFFRESCFYQSGDAERTFNPTVYRTPAQYNYLMTSVTTQSGDRGFEIVMSKSVQTYIKIKKNQNQVCWLLQKVPREPNGHQGYVTFQQFLDNQQYSRKGILRYEKIFGEGFVSTGGLETTKEFISMLNPVPGQQVVDVGCGIGGGDFYMAKTYGVEVLGMDLSSNMVEIAMERAINEKIPLVQFEIGDATRRIFPDGTFDVVYSRDTILHINDKKALFKRFYSWLKPGGKLLITDYCCGEQPWSPVFQEYVKQRGYVLYTPEEYGQFLEKVGFVNVQAQDRTEQFVQVLNKELTRTQEIKQEFIESFSEEDYNYIIDGWKEKLHRCSLGDQRWGLFYAEKPLQIVP
ncbi:phosphomethylethanolamine N-methyltransferase-like isoform X2 [Rana temporaria]|uniref:phosphomethylethanolamine N-methyltransferase-like isoform X2 n=1 Tax=Rana temporaria TaxID=8407 RepID=UPI001AAD8865|nr:phosphomethylethanolamine N-methyltransferase-like isoform X2 [Rana temporaria]